MSSAHHKAFLTTKDAAAQLDIGDGHLWVKNLLAKPDSKIRVGTLFSGIGAVEHALKRLNVATEVVFAGDIDPHVKKSYLSNYPIDESRWHDDVTEFDARNHRG